MNHYKYGITPKELRLVRKFIMEDIRSNNKITNPIQNMTLQIYFDMIKECMLGAADENGVVFHPWGDNWVSKCRKQDIRKVSSVEVARIWMDGRGLFTEHFNSQLYGNKKHYGNWPNINAHEQNQWYHEDRLNDPLWFKECVSVIGHAGHPTECQGCGNFNPVEYETDKWYLDFDTFSRSNFYTLKGYLHFKKIGIPAFIYGAQVYLTNKQKEELKKEGYLGSIYTSTGYYERDTSNIL